MSMGHSCQGAAIATNATIEKYTFSNQPPLPGWDRAVSTIWPQASKHFNLPQQYLKCFTVDLRRISGPAWQQPSQTNANFQLLLHINIRGNNTNARLLEIKETVQRPLCLSLYVCLKESDCNGFNKCFVCLHYLYAIFVLQMWSKAASKWTRCTEQNFFKWKTRSGRMCSYLDFQIEFWNMKKMRLCKSELWVLRWIAKGLTFGASKSAMPQICFQTFSIFFIYCGTPVDRWRLFSVYNRWAHR